MKRSPAGFPEVTDRPDAPDGSDPPSGPDAALRRRDEVLQILFWMRGEGLGDTTRPSDLLPLLGERAADLESTLDTLRELGLIECVDGERYRLTERGIAEGGRRFADEFSGLTAQAHGECADPDCDCHDDPAAAIDCLARRQGHDAHTRV